MSAYGAVVAFLSSYELSTRDILLIGGGAPPLPEIENRFMTDFLGVAKPGYSVLHECVEASQ